MKALGFTQGSGAATPDSSPASWPLGLDLRSSSLVTVT